VNGDDDLCTPAGLVVPASALTWTFSRAAGPGGQHVNKTSSRATLSIDTAAVTGDEAAVARLQSKLGPELRVVSQDSRSQWQNRRICIERASAALDDAARPPAPARRRSRPTKGSVERRLDDKRRASEKKQNRQQPEW